MVVGEKLHYHGIEKRGKRGGLNGCQLLSFKT
jgi:hypothetical protein